MEKIKCLDDGICHHQCLSNSKADCFRINHQCVPLKQSGLDDNWNKPKSQTCEYDNWKPSKDLV
jgi:hypothetical protein